MSRLQDTHSPEAPVDSAQVNESEERVWRQPTLSAWKIEEETLDFSSSGADIAG